MPEIVFTEKPHAIWHGRERIPTATQVMGELGFINADFFTVESRIRGQRVHQGTHLLDVGDLDWDSLKRIEEALGEPIVPYVQAWARFKRETGFISHIIERPCWNRRYRVGGVVDRIGEFPDDKYDAVVDLKSMASGNKVPFWTAYQTGGYDEMIPRIGGRPRKRYGVGLKPNGDFVIDPFTDVNDGLTFLQMANIFHKGFEHGVYKYRDDE